VAYYTRVLSKDDEFPAFEELAQLIRTQHPDFRLSIEEGSEEEWEVLLLSSLDEVEVALLERNPVSDGSVGQDEIADFLEDLRDCKPNSGVQWLEDYLSEVKTIYAFQHLQGSETVDGGNALHALRSSLWERGDAIIQADGEGFTNEEGYHMGVRLSLSQTSAEGSPSCLLRLRLTLSSNWITLFIGRIVFASSFLELVSKIGSASRQALTLEVAELLSFCYEEAAEAVD
jgi:hypothetical protein